MIIDHISNFPQYCPIHPGFRCALDYLRNADLAAMSVGKYEIDGDNIYAMLQHYNTKLKEQVAWEAHRRFIDLQYVVQGVEQVGYANLSRLTQDAYDPARDFLPLHGQGDFFTLLEGNFVILMPGDAHMPGIALASPSLVKKVVIKIAVVMDSSSSVLA